VFLFADILATRWDTHHKWRMQGRCRCAASPALSELGALQRFSDSIRECIETMATGNVAITECFTQPACHGTSWIKILGLGCGMCRDGVVRAKRTGCLEQRQKPRRLWLSLGAGHSNLASKCESNQHHVPRAYSFDVTTIANLHVALEISHIVCHFSSPQSTRSRSISRIREPCVVQCLPSTKTLLFSSITIFEFHSSSKL
jgi:hypothetical protein